MDIRDLNKIDIKDLRNIDLNQLKENIQKRPDILINILLISITIFVIIYVFNKQQKKAQELKNIVVTMKSKLDAVKLLDEVKKQNEEFVKNFPVSIPSDRIIDKISELAVSRNVQIVNFQPAQQKNNNILEYTSMTLSISATDYQDIILFIKDIEESSNSLRVDRWSGGLEQRSGGRRSQQQVQTEKKNLIVAEIDIGSIKLKP